MKPVRVTLRSRLARVLFLMLPFVLFSAPLHATPPANIVLIVADDLGWHDLGFMGGDNVLTPRIDELAGLGVVCRTAYVTAPVCSPSRAGMLTGRHQCRFGHETNPGESLEKNAAFGLPVTESTIADRLKPLGYTNGWIGKSHLGWADTPTTLPGYHPLRRGFDRHFGFLMSHHHYVDPSIPNPETFPPQNQLDPIRSDGDLVLETQYLTYAFAREARQFIGAHQDQPFFLYLPLSAVHFPLESTDELKGRFAGVTGISDTRRRLLEVLAGLDDAVGSVLDALDDYGVRENTLVIFTSDNGGDTTGFSEAHNLPLKGGKTEVYEGGLRVPFIVHWPAGNIQGGIERTAPVSTLDILPTAVRAAGGVVPAAWQLDGVDLKPYLSGATSVAPHANLFWRVETDGVDPGTDVHDGMRAMRSNEWKLVKRGVNFNWELYNLLLDEGESTDLAATEPAQLKTMIAQWEAWNAQLMRPRWAVDDLEYPSPAFILDDVPLGSITAGYHDIDVLPNAPHLAFQDTANNLWRAGFDPLTGNLLSVDGHDQLIDTGAASLALSVNGPQWALSTAGASVLYTKLDSTTRRQVWRAEIGTNVTRSPVTLFPATDQFEPRVSQLPGSSVVKLAYNRGTSASYTPIVANATSPAIGAALPANPVHAGGASNGRWLPNAADLAYLAHPATAPATTEIFRWRSATGAAEQITDDGSTLQEAWAFLAPEIGNELAYVAIENRNAIAVFRDPKDQANGHFDRIATLTLPVGYPPRFLYSLRPLSGLRGFNGTSYFSCLACENDDLAAPGATEVWMFTLGPDANHRPAWRVDAPMSGLARDPETAVGTRDVFLFYTRQDGANPSQLRRANTGLLRPDFAGAPSGFTSLGLEWEFSAGDVDTNTKRMGATETTQLVAHESMLFAGQSSTHSPDNPVSGTTRDPAYWSGAQMLVRDSESAAWKVDLDLPGHVAVEALASVRFQTDGATPNDTLDPMLVASFRDLTGIGGGHVSLRCRMLSGAWEHSDISTNLAPGEPTALAMHVDRDGTAPVHFLFAGISSGEIHRAYFHEASPGNLNWGVLAPQPANPELSGTGPVRGLAEANGLLYAACGLRQEVAGGLVRGGLYVRDDANGTWSLVYRWPGPAPLYTAAEEDRVMTGLTVVPDPRGSEVDSLLGARSWPGVIERIDPSRGHRVTVELDVRDFFARRWNDDSVRTATVRLGYTPFTPVVDPVTGERIHLVNVWIEHPGAATPPHNGSHFLVRHRDGTYEAADLENFSPQLSAGTGLHATRCIAASPFAGEAGHVIYFGGYDAPESSLARDTAWILRGTWSRWPTLTITQPDVPLFQLTAPALSNDWVLESSPSLGAAANWQPVTGRPTFSTSATTLSLGSTLPKEFFRLRKN